MKKRFLPMVPAASAIALLSGCQEFDAHAPTIDVLGSYFPSWMACIVLGIILTLIIRLFLIGLEIDAYLKPRLTVYCCMMALFTMSIWLIFFKN